MGQSRKKWKELGRTRLKLEQARIGAQLRALKDKLKLRPDAGSLQERMNRLRDTSMLIDFRLRGTANRARQRHD
jgi:hypothetical protein